MKNTIVIFAKAPVPGRVKTRLVPPLSFERAASLYRDWARATLETANRVRAAEVWIAYESAPHFPTPEWMASPAPRHQSSGSCSLHNG